MDYLMLALEDNISGITCCLFQSFIPSSWRFKDYTSKSIVMKLYICMPLILTSNLPSWGPNFMTQTSITDFGGSYYKTCLRLLV